MKFIKDHGGNIVFICLVLLFIVGLVFVFFANSRKSSATAGDNIAGYAWSSNIGWVKFNSCEDPVNDINCNPPDYGVNLAQRGMPNNYDFSGYAWSSNIGWLNFEGGDNTCPSGPGGCDPRIQNGTVEGWIRACAVFETGTGCSEQGGSVLRPPNERGGWDGWISLNCTNTAGGCANQSYSVVFNPGSFFSGYAWGGDVVGWLSFSDFDYGVEHCVGSCLGGGPGILTVTCAAQPSVGFVNQTINWVAITSGGLLSFTYTWMFDEIPASEDASEVTRSYTSTGTHTASVTATDQLNQSATAMCQVTILGRITEEPPIAL